MTDKYSILNNVTTEQFDQLHTLTQKMWWSTDRTKEEMVTLLKHSLPFAVIDNSTQQLVGFARVLTDEVRYAYIYDVMTDESLRGKGIGKMIMNAILSHPQLSRVKYFELTCAPEMVDYYLKLGFTCDYGIVMPMRFTSKCIGAEPV